MPDWVRATIAVLAIAAVVIGILAMSVKFDNDRTRECEAKGGTYVAGRTQTCFEKGTVIR